MAAKVRRKKQEYHGNIFWVTMTDLFIGMFMIFATLFFAFSANTGQNARAAVTNTTKASVSSIVRKMQSKNINAVARPETVNKEELKPTDKKIDVEIDPFTGMAKISDMELFELNKSELTPIGKEFLGKFLPVYLDEVLMGDLRKYILYIVIQGHTDSQLFKGSFSPQEQYMKNMNLSINRAYNVANYAFQISKNKPYYKDLTHIIRVEGASFSKPVFVDGKENYALSRRVELRLVLKEQKFDVLQQFLQRGTGEAKSEYENLR